MLTTQLRSQASLFRIKAYEIASWVKQFFAWHALGMMHFHADKPWQDYVFSLNQVALSVFLMVSVQKETTAVLTENNTMPSYTAL